MSEEGVDRRLTTILSADVVGYSRLMGEDEVGTLAALKAHRKELVVPKEAQYHGRTIKLMGDGTLMEFGSVVDAVHFAVEVQIAMRARNAEVPELRHPVNREPDVPRLHVSMDHSLRVRMGQPCGDFPPNRQHALHRQAAVGTAPDHSGQVASGNRSTPATSRSGE